MNIFSLRAISYLIGALSVSHAMLLAADFNDPKADRDALPKVPDGFVVTMWAREPLVRQPCSLAFDARGRLFVGMGPQYRNPTPETPGDSVVIVSDSDGDGSADATKVFATGFNAIQGLAWHGNDLWVGNAPDLTIVRDLDGDDEADEYVRLYTDLGNLEHGLHGLNWAPDGKLYMSKGNSKGLTQPGRYAPKPFRDLWGVKAPAETPNFPELVVFRKGQYQHNFHDPSDDWGLDGGILRCDDGGHNLEIVSRGFRNPWDITSDSGFNWLGTDNDQTQGDRVFMSFHGAHFGWNHAWSAHWGDQPHAPTAPVSGPLFEGSGTGVIYYDSPQFPAEYRGVFFVNDWLRKTTFLWKPEWDGALMKPHQGNWTPFVEGGTSLFRPTDIEVGPDGALWILGWSSGYGAEWKDGELTNEGRIFRVAHKEASSKDAAARHATAPIPKATASGSHSGAAAPLNGFSKLSIEELVSEFAGPLPVRRINAQDELVRRGADVASALLNKLRRGQLSTMQETWTVWALGRMQNIDASVGDFLAGTLKPDSGSSLNLKIQTVRIFAHRFRQFEQAERLSEVTLSALTAAEPRLRFAGVQAVLVARQRKLMPALLNLLADESDRTTFYSGWQTLRELMTPEEIRLTLTDARSGVRQAALLALLETHELKPADVTPFTTEGHDARTREIAQLWLSKAANGAEQAVIRGLPLHNASPENSQAAPLVRILNAASGRRYRAVAGGFSSGTPTYTDRQYRITQLPKELEGLDLLQTPNDDDGSKGDVWLTGDVALPVRMLVAIDQRQKQPPQWVREAFKLTEYTVTIDEGAKFRLYARNFPAGSFELGGNTDDGRAGGKGNLFAIVEPIALARRETSTTIDQVLAAMEHADPDRGESLFRHPRAIGCGKCHSLDVTKNAFGPNLSSIGQRANLRHIVQSIVEPSSVITEGFNLQTVVTTDGKSYSGVLVEESGLSLSLGLSTGERVDIPKTAIDERSTSRTSAMPVSADLLSPEQIADLAAFLLAQKTPIAAGGSAVVPMTSANPTVNASGGPDNEAKTHRGGSDRAGGTFSFEQKDDRLLISLDNKSVAQFVFQDEKILRPYFASVKTPGGRQVTRNQPPINGVDATDHDTMHPGIWLGFGNISGHDFWRNKASIEHRKFLAPPVAKDHQLTFATESQLMTSAGTPLCRLTSQFTLQARSGGWLLIWDSTFHADDHEFTFGDQEEMGFGARVATPITEKSGGRILNSSGLTSAGKTWGQPAKWCDYSGGVGEAAHGITLMSAPSNFRECWWHNRDYGVFVANPFGQAAMKQGDVSTIPIKQGDSLRLVFGALVHDGIDIDHATEYTDFVRLCQP